MKDETMTIRLSAELKKQIAAGARKSQRSMSQLIIDAILKHLKTL